ncbi:UV damage endonuclease UvdE [Phialophora macrospora]|uniref:UV damage endonuclease UvdE n=1 Tax=Phialophora macrospora TaxID=1851006 RepID=A0A0D2DPF1_9EURO|nr:UV damage endonuclease UvdE [Phialophora macrospora]
MHTTFFHEAGCLYFFILGADELESGIYGFEDRRRMIALFRSLRSFVLTPSQILAGRLCIGHGPSAHATLPQRILPPLLNNMGKRKRTSGADTPAPGQPSANVTAPSSKRRISSRRVSAVPPAKVDTNPDTNTRIKDGADALRASPDAEEAEVRDVKSKRAKKAAPKKVKAENKTEPQDVAQVAEGLQTASVGLKIHEQRDDGLNRGDPEAEDDEEANPDELKEALSRPPPVNSPYLPLPWKGRLGYACLNTYLRAANPPVFSSRTCRIASILEHRHPLKDPTQPEHATKNRPDKDKAPDIARGQAYVEALGLANARDIPKMLRWNDRYGIKFMRLSSEMFPFASHDVYGYRLAPFASEALAEAGRVAAELGHRLTTHPGQFTQLGSPRKEVVTASLRDLEYHCELLDLLNLPPQQNRDAVMILHMGGAFGDKAVTIARFKQNYVKLSQGIKDRLVLENDDVIYSVHDLLPVCEELNIPLVLDFHHHNIVFDAEKVREGTQDIMPLYDRIKATWTRKNITQKMHYSEPTPSAITARQRRKHNPRPATLPPCAPDMDLMIEAKDKEQAVFELMRTFKLPGFDTFNDIIPYVRHDENKPWKAPKQKKNAKKTKRQSKSRPEDDDRGEGEGQGQDEEEAESTPRPPPIVPDSEVSMGGPDRRVYWPSGMEEWLRPKKREVKPRDPVKARSTAERAALRRAEKAAWQAAREASADAGTETAVTTGSASGTSSETDAAAATPAKDRLDLEKTRSVYDMAKTSGKMRHPARAPGKNAANQSTVNEDNKEDKQQKKNTKPKPVLTPSDSGSDLTELEADMDMDTDRSEEDPDTTMPDLTDAEDAASAPSPHKARKASSRTRTRTTSARNAKKTAVNYAEGDGDEGDQEE